MGSQKESDDEVLASLQEQLGLLNDGLIESFGETLDLNADIIAATRTMAHNLLTIRQGHLFQAERILGLVQALAEANHLTAQLNADLLAAEFGLPQDADYMDDEDEEDEDDE
jgi:hypothetical protein